MPPLIGPRELLIAIGPREIIFIVLLAVLFFGARRLPDLARGIGSGIRNFRGSLQAGAERDSEPGEEQRG